VARQLLIVAHSQEVSTMRRFALLALAAAPSLVGCGSSPDATPFEVAKSSLVREPPSAPAGDIETLAKDGASFAMDLYAHTAAKGADTENAIFSPHSIQVALAMTSAGARGQTEKDIATAMHWSLPQQQLHPAMNALDQALASRGQNAKGADGKPFRLQVTNTTFGQKGYPFEQPFLDVLAKHYGAGVGLVDFIEQREQARSVINKWVSDKTEGRIEQLIPENALTKDTRLVLVNAVYFNGAWATPFPDGNTASKEFTRLDGTKIQVPTMTSEPASLPYLSTETLEAVELPYDGGEVSMVVVAPRAGFKAWEKGFDGKAALDVMAGLKVTEVQVSLPKFEIKGATVRLKEPLSAMGMAGAFDDRADFTGIVPATVDRLRIEEVLHKAFVKVDEKGTEAAASTAVIVGRLTAAPADPRPVRIDRPFVFFLRDRPTNTILFVGRVVSPS
jgi:serpin B